MHRTLILPAALAITGAGCADDSLSVPDDYAFTSRYDHDLSSVSYSGQVLRQVLIADLDHQIGELGSVIDGASAGGTPIGKGDVEASLLFYYQFDSSVSGTATIAMTADLPLLQTRYADIAVDKDLVGKIAGNDPITDHRDWSTDFVGYPGSPDQMLRALVQEIDDLAVARYQGTIATDPSGAQIDEVYVTSDGRHLQELVQKLLIGAVTVSQALDDYLDDDVDGKGLLSPNTRDEDEPFTSLEHSWDEAFGYFGASRTFLSEATEDITSGTTFDANGDGKLDLSSERSFPMAAYAARRDGASVVPTDYSRQIVGAFLEGRALIAAMDETPSAADLDALRRQRDIISIAWQRSIAANVIHYINKTVADLDAMDDDTYEFAKHAGHWSEMKSFALALQFAPRSPLSHEDQVQLHELFGAVPVLADAPSEVRVQHRANLLAARDLLTTTFELDDENSVQW